LENFLREDTEPDNVIAEDEPHTEFVFACTEEHKKELDLFIGMLISESFSLEYFEDIYLNQFVRVLCHFLKRVISSFWHKSFGGLEIVSSCIIDTNAVETLDEKRPFKVLFIPYLNSKNYTDIIKSRASLS
jgi:hypothetical protein